MTHKILAAAACFVTCVSLTACASSPKGYGPAYGTDFGFRNTQLQQDRFRVSYTSRDAYESQDFALLRAAQIAENEGYSHFKVVGGDYYDNGPNRIGSHIGVSLGNGRYNRSRTNIGVGVNDISRAVEGRKVTETIEVILLQSAPANDTDVYSAKSLMKNIVPPNMRPAPKNP